MNIQVVAERELKIESEVKEMKKVFFCELCSKQYKLAVEFEAHLSSYDHNHRKRFKEMKEMQGASSRDERLRREQLRQEREIAKFAQMATAAAQAKGSSATAVAEPEQRQTLKFGFSSRQGTKGTAATAAGSAGGGKRPKAAPTVCSAFGNDSDDEP